MTAPTGPDLWMYRGEKKVFPFTALDNGAAIDLTSATIKFTVRSSYPDGSVVSDADALFTLTTSSGIAITDATNGAFEVTMVNATTNSISQTLKKADYYYGIEYVPNGETDPRVLAQGTFTLYTDIVRA